MRSTINKPSDVIAEAQVQASNAQQAPDKDLQHAIVQLARQVRGGTLAIPTRTAAMQIVALGEVLESGKRLTINQGLTALTWVYQQRNTLQSDPTGQTLIRATDAFAAHVVHYIREQIGSETPAKNTVQRAVVFMQTLEKHPSSKNAALAASELMPRLRALLPEVKPRTKRKASKRVDDSFASPTLPPDAKRPRLEHVANAARMGAVMHPASSDSIIRRAVDQALRPAQLANLARPADTIPEFAAQHADPLGAAHPTHGTSFSQAASAALAEIVPSFARIKSQPIGAETMRFLGLPSKQRIRYLISSRPGPSYLMTQALNGKRGSSGKVRAAIDLQHGDIWALKQIRTPQSIPKGPRTKKLNKRIPAPNTEQDILKEIEIAKLVDPELAPKLRILAGGDNYLLMPFVLGDSHEIASRLPISLRQCTNRVMLEDIMTALADRMHAQNILHGDMKSQNALVQKDTGTTHISDFGCAVQLKPGAMVKPGGFISGTYTAPEKCLEDPYGLKSDVWEIGASALSLILGFSGQSVVNPFTWIRSRTGTIDLEAMTQMHDAYDTWFDSRLNDDGRLDPIKMNNPNNVFDRLFSRALAADPTVTQYIAGRMLRVDPDKRASSSECKAFFASLNASHPQEAQKGRETLVSMSYDVAVSADLIALDRVREHVARTEM